MKTTCNKGLFTEICASFFLRNFMLNRSKHVRSKYFPTKPNFSSTLSTPRCNETITIDLTDDDQSLALQEEVSSIRLREQLEFSETEAALFLQQENFREKYEIISRLSIYPINLPENLIRKLANSSTFTVISNLLLGNVAKLQYLAQKGISTRYISSIAIEDDGENHFNVLLNALLQLKHVLSSASLSYNDVNRLLMIEGSLPLIQFISSNIDTLVYVFNFTSSQIYSIARHPRALITFNYLIRMHEYFREFSFTNQDIFAISNYNCGKENIGAAIEAAERLRPFGFENWHIVRIIANGQENGFEKINVLINEADCLINERQCSVWEVLLLSVNSVDDICRFLRFPAHVHVNTILQELWQGSEHIRLQSSTGVLLQRDSAVQLTMTHRSDTDEPVTEDEAPFCDPLKSPTFRLCALRQSFEYQNEPTFSELINHWARLETLALFGVCVYHLLPLVAQQDTLPVFRRTLWLLEAFYFGNIFSTANINVLLHCNNSAHFLEFVALNCSELFGDKLSLSCSDVCEIAIANHSVEKLKMLIEIMPQLISIGFSKAFIIKLFSSVDEREHINQFIDCATNLLPLDFSVDIALAFIKDDVISGIKALRAIVDCSEWLFHEQRIDSEELYTLFRLKLKNKFLEFLDLGPKLTKHGLRLSQIANMVSVRYNDMQQLAQDFDCCEKKAIFNQNEKNFLLQCGNFITIIRFIVQHLLPLMEAPINLTGEHICRIVRTNDSMPKFNQLLVCSGIMRLVNLDMEQIVTLLVCNNGVENIEVMLTMAYPLLRKGFQINAIFDLIIGHSDNGARVIRAIYDNIRWLMDEQRMRSDQILAKIKELRDSKRFLDVTQYGPQLTGHYFTFDQLIQIALFTEDPGKIFDDLLQNKKQYLTSNQAVEIIFMKIMTRVEDWSMPNKPEPRDARSQTSPPPTRPMSMFFKPLQTQDQQELHNDCRRRQQRSS